MTASRRIVCFNIGHAIDHMFVMIFPAAVLGMQADFVRRYRELIALSLCGSSPLSQVRCPPNGSSRVDPPQYDGDLFSRHRRCNSGYGFATISWELAAGLAAIGLLRAIYNRSRR